MIGVDRDQTFVFAVCTESDPREQVLKSAWAYALVHRPLCRCHIRVEGLMEKDDTIWIGGCPISKMAESEDPARLVHGSAGIAIGGKYAHDVKRQVSGGIPVMSRQGPVLFNAENGHPTGVPVDQANWGYRKKHLGWGNLFCERHDLDRMTSFSSSLERAARNGDQLVYLDRRPEITEEQSAC